jgi:hypothetical protein
MLVQLGLFFAYYQEVGSPVKVNVKERLRLIQRMKRVAREGIGEPLPKKSSFFLGGSRVPFLAYKWFKYAPKFLC